MFRELLAAVALEPGSVSLLEQRFFAAHRDQLRTLWHSGVEYGQFPSSIDADDAIDLLIGPLVFRLLLDHGPVGSDAARHLAQTALHGLGCR